MVGDRFPQHFIAGTTSTKEATLEATYSGHTPFIYIEACHH